MKTFFATVVIFLLLLGIILWNTLFVNATVQELEVRLSALSTPQAAADSLTALEDYWQEQRCRIRLSVPSETVLRLDTHLAALRAALLVGDAAGFARARAEALTVVRSIRDAERPTLDNLL